MFRKIMNFKKESYRELGIELGLILHSKPPFHNFGLLKSMVAFEFENETYILKYSHQCCRSPSLGLVTKARAYKGAGQEKAWECKRV
jgi:hypothetical protein